MGAKRRATKMNERSFENKSYKINFKKICLFMLEKNIEGVLGGERVKEEEMRCIFIHLKPLHPLICFETGTWILTQLPGQFK